MNNELSFVQEVLYIFGPVLVNLERKEITRNNIDKEFPPTSQIKLKAPISRKQRRRTCTLPQCYYCSL